MDIFKRVLRTEPVLFSNAIKAIGALLVVWGLPVTGVDIDNFNQLVVSGLAFATFALSFFERSQVFSQRTHDAVVEEATRENHVAGEAP